jgi:bifunctional UDP-N-acetylglucosamine pyrophosphorylase/glucosamine-1-phosphate N-acetyltransferase
LVERPYGYGRILRVDGQIARIVEERDASPAERQIREINSGIYAFDLARCSTPCGASRRRTRKGSSI